MTSVLEFANKPTLCACLTLVVAACGSGGGMQMSPAPTATMPPPMTPMALVLSSTANDQLTEFDLGIQDISLKSTSGRTVSIFAQAQAPEFMHVNGALEPLATGTIPQDLYTEATVTVSSANFTCITLQPDGGLLTAQFAYGQTPTAHVTASLAAPIRVGSEPVGIALDMLVSRSASWAACGAGATYDITPTFSLSAFEFSSGAPAPQHQSVSSLDGEVTALDSGSGGFEISLPRPGASVHIAIGDATVWQGVTGPTNLHPGTFVELDGALRSDGSIAASRVAVEDPSAVDVQRGPLLFISNAVPTFDMYPRQAQGTDGRVITETFAFNGSSRFQVSGELSNLKSLPFTPSFGAANMVPGQAVYVSTPAFAGTGSYFAVANTITLVPQTVNGTVTAVGASGDFSVYTVTLASYDLLSLLAVQPGQTTLVGNPGVLEVYADTHTAMLTSAAPASGDTLRFYGLVFNDKGTLRMDCAQISAGVTPLSQ